MMKRISFVFPVYDEEANLAPLCAGVTEACRTAEVDYELIFVENGSRDNSLAVIKDLRAKDGRVRYLSLSRNFGHQNALYAGLKHATGDAAITMDADLQHPPELIPKLVEAWQAGAEVVYTVKEDYRLSAGRYLSMLLFYRLISKVSGIQLSFGQSDFRLMDRRALDALLSMNEYHKFLRGQVSWIGFRQTGIPYRVAPRRNGVSKFSYRNLLSFALDGIFAFSRYPLHLIMLLGVGMSFASLLYLALAMIVFGLKVCGVSVPLPWPPGWLSLIVAVTLFGSIQLIAIGILGEYIGRVYDQVKGRPSYIVRESSLGPDEGMRRGRDD